MMKSRVRPAIVLTILLVALTTGCVGPNKLKRGLDQAANRRYHESPLLAQLLFPFSLLMNHIAITGDLLIINPTYWWKDVLRGEGTIYTYENIEKENPEGDPEAGSGE